MTEAAEKTEKRRHRSPNGPGLFVTDQELIDILGVPERDARLALEALDQNPASGFPQKDRLWGGRRYLPAVREYLDKTHGLGIKQHDFGVGNVEKFDVRRRKRP